MSQRLQLAALTIGIGASVGLAYLLYRKTFTRYLYISAGEGGTTDPPPGTYAKRLNEEVTITALPEEGYTYGTWVVDGVDWGHKPSITLTMDTHHTVICTFWKGGVPPPTYPIKIKSLGPAQVLSKIGGKVIPPNCIVATYCGPNWEWDTLTEAPIQFQALDPNDRPVPDVDIALWTDPMPDTGRYRGILLMNGAIRTVQQPLILKTDQNGTVTAKLAYLYGLDDDFLQLSTDADVFVNYSTFCADKQYLVAHLCLPEGLRICWTKGECATALPGCERMGGWQLNRVYAKIVGTIYETTEWAYCGFHVGWAEPYHY